MFNEMMPMSSGGGGKVAISDMKPISASANPSWNITPFKADRILICTGLYYSGLKTWYHANFDPSTGVVDNRYCWSSYDGGVTWVQENTAWKVTDTYIELLSPLSGATNVNCTFIITEHGEFTLE